MTYNVVVLNGPPESGKDTVCDFMHDHIIDRNINKRIMQAKFSEPLKVGIHALFGILDEYGEVAKHDAFEDVKETPQEKFFGMTPREAYIWGSEEVMKPRFGNFVFGQIMANKLQWFFDTDFADDYNTSPLLVISDCGFKEEVEFLASVVPLKQILRIRLFRTGKTFQNDSRSWFEYEGLPNIDLINNGTVDDLHVQIKAIVNDFELYV